MPSRSSFLIFTLVCLACHCVASQESRLTSELYRNHGATPKNVLFLAVDDMKDWVGCLGGYEGTVHTPHIDALAQSGVLFANAHCPSPKCAPSRAAILSGLRPSTTGLYDNKHWWMPNYPNMLTLPRFFKKQGYEVRGAGKIFHHTAGNNPPVQWDDFNRLTFQSDPWFRGNRLNYPWSAPVPEPAGFPFAKIPGLPHENDWGWLPAEFEPYDDELTAQYAVDFLKSLSRSPGKKNTVKPFFLACGIFRPHLPWYVPQEFFDRYPLEQVVLPKLLKDDLGDVPEAGRALAAARRSDLDRIRKAERMREAVQGYLASITYADHQIGRVLQALEDSGLASDTMVIFWSDHGWHLGEKDHWHKSTLWEEATRVPFIIRAPSYPGGQVCLSAVSLLDIYPTLAELCRTSLNTAEAVGPVQLPEFDGRSLKPLLEDASREWDYPVLVEFKRGNAAVRSNRFRYIRYADGSEEFYDHASDSLEWHNLAGKPEHAAEIVRHAKLLPSSWAPDAKSKKAFDFHPESYSWRSKDTGKLIQGE